MTEKYFADIEKRPDVFPVIWQVERLFREVVEWFAGDLSRQSTLITKSVLNSRDWSGVQLTELVNSFQEKWYFPDGLLICVWDVNQSESEAPLGFVAFEIAWNETRRKRISDLFLTINLFWVRPDKRGYGAVVAKHLLSHFLIYLMECNLVLPIVSPGGAIVFYYADLYSNGGDAISSIIEEHLELMQAQGIWRMRDLVCDVGF